MSDAIPVICEPIYRTKPWGGRSLAELFGKPLPTEEPVGESWELVSLPEADSVVRDGPLKGTTLSHLVQDWERDLYGGAALADGRFPLLIKFLDARDHLSVQVHPKPTSDSGWEVGIKHEAWYVLQAEPDAQVFIGFKAGVTAEDVKTAAGTPAFRDLMHARPAQAGDCFYLPSGTVHALGAGLVVAEVQTPSDTTYRFYDWDRVGLDGQPRELHLEQAIDNARYDVAETEICQPQLSASNKLGDGQRVAACHAFTMDRYRCAPGTYGPLMTGVMRIWMVLSGRGSIGEGASELAFVRGDTLLVPAVTNELVRITEPTELIEVRIPL